MNDWEWEEERKNNKKTHVSQFQMELISSEGCSGIGWKGHLALPRATLGRVSKHHWTSVQMVSGQLLAPESLVRADQWVISKTRSSTDSYKWRKGRFTSKGKPEWPPGICETSYWSEEWNPVAVSNTQRAWSRVIRRKNYKVVGPLAQTQEHKTFITLRHCNSLNTP